MADRCIKFCLTNLWVFPMHAIKVLIFDDVTSVKMCENVKEHRRYFIIH